MGIEMKAFTQYCDFNGTSAIDWQGGTSDFIKLCRDMGINTDKYQPVGVSIFFGDGNFFSLSIYVKENNKPLNEKGEYPIIKVMTEIEAEKFFQYAKRLDIQLFNTSINENEYYQEKVIEISELPA
jgi:hypothetical protein